MAAGESRRLETQTEFREFQSPLKGHTRRVARFDHRIIWAVDGPVGAIGFLITTLEAHPGDDRYDIYANFSMAHPVEGGFYMAYDLGAHYNYQGEADTYHEECPSRGNNECWYDGGSTLYAERILKLWSEHRFDQDWLFAYLEEIYPGFMGL